MTRFSKWRRRVGAATLIVCLHAGAAAEMAPDATRILDARDHAELTAAISKGGVVRVALIGDRIARVVRAPGGWSVEHDADAGDIYLRPPAEIAAPDGPVALFIGSERGYTYRLTLEPAVGGPAQILLRNPAAGSVEDSVGRQRGGGRVETLAALIRAAANGTPPAGYAIGPTGDCCAVKGVSALEVWRGSGFEAWVLRVGGDGPGDALTLAEGLGPDIAAAWIADAGGESSGEGRAMSRLAVAVREARAE
ncbi:MAG: type-F conjugative transfer system secretin TraK [Gammaproteobacteria bacterium]|nr:type-F conjugative transfer system secretin TraK [Gammaproteobacteria bacterium]